MTTYRSVPDDDARRILRIVRGAQVALGALAAVATVSVGLTPWAPLPLLASLVAWELSPWKSRLGGMTLTLDDGLRLLDLTREPPAPIAAADLLAATAWRFTGDVRDELHILVWSRGGAMLHLRAWVPGHAWLDGAVDLDDAEDALGGLPGWRDTIAPPSARGRLMLLDPDGQLWPSVRALLPPDARERMVMPAWSGPSPPADPAGRLPDPPSGLLEVDAHTWRWGGREGSLRPIAAHRARHAQPTWIGPRKQAVIVVDLLLIDLDGGLTLGVASPVASAFPEAPDGAHVAHVHAVHAAALLPRLVLHDAMGVLATVSTVLCTARPAHENA